ncbi:MAG: hypothetical protein WCS33_00465 [Candidatus Caldatribacteriota bacterium]
MGDKFGVKEVMNVTFYDLVSWQPSLYIDTLKLSNLENTAEQSMARGGVGNPILLTWDYNREANFEVQDALMTMKSLSMLAGTQLKTDEDTILHMREILEVSATDDITLSQTPLDGDETDKLFIYKDDDDSGTPLVINDITGKVVSLDYGEQVEEGDKVVVYYPYETDALTERPQIVTITSEDFPGYYRVVGDTVVRNARTGLDEKFQLIVERAKIMPGFTVSMQAEGDPAVFDMNLMVFKPVDKTEMIKMVKY